ncbi:unnamed protein product [Brachionus calyciflorus]|uniref:Uncharacterized protein n=1 Tax=Brachionus calyciflorus TaxID=104777 RepID=A0A814QH65_9BILA|nr:unnamed protein product [Brachionus calyciflorus]
MENKTLKAIVDINSSTLSRIDFTINKVSLSILNTHIKQHRFNLIKQIPGPNKRQLQNCDNTQKWKQFRNDNTEPGNNLNSNSKNLNRPKPQQGKKSLISFDSSKPELPNKDLLDEKEMMALNIFDRDKNNDKSLWPRGTVINRYHRPYIQKNQQDVNNQMDIAPQASSSSQ